MLGVPVRASSGQLGHEDRDLVNSYHDGVTERWQRGGGRWLEGGHWGQALQG